MYSFHRPRPIAVSDSFIQCSSAVWVQRICTLAKAPRTPGKPEKQSACSGRRVTVIGTIRQKPAFRFLVGHPFSFLGVLGALAREHWSSEEHTSELQSLMRSSDAVF